MAKHNIIETLVIQFTFYFNVLAGGKQVMSMFLCVNYSTYSPKIYPLSVACRLLDQGTLDSLRLRNLVRLRDFFC